jgi:hypothetical protein
MPRINNNEARRYVQHRCSFKASNLFAERKDIGGLYVVYSYGYHWPLWVYDPKAEVWLENLNRYSLTTTRHRVQTNPYPDYNGRVVRMTCDDLKFLIIVGGLAEFTAVRMGAA